MTATATKRVDEFRQLEPSGQRWVCNEIPRFAPFPGCGPLPDDALTAIADQTFVLLDKEEADAQLR